MLPTAAAQPLNLELVTLCEDLCKVAIQLIDGQLAFKPAPPQIIMEKVASAGVDDRLIEQVIDALDSRGMVNPGGREKLASLYKTDPNELAHTVLELTNVVRPSTDGGTAVDHHSLPTKSASAHTNPTSEEEAEKREWQDLARGKQL